MQTFIRSWGNSQGLYIPKKLLKEASINVNDPVEISVVDGALMIRRNDSTDLKRNALNALREIRNAHRVITDSISEDYRTERNEYIDEKYGK
ncbi:MAG: AbrB/MazE/SpoVT family DNA-binding domain-containing protein [Mogibacterium sp.]|nr:AbrB/MazE/SpoVT family DNA-binding domain-containing protein [Mogibacterium sp.]